jgi:prepilin-type N-terminal cleavage/methylation domain-containing protein
MKPAPSVARFPGFTLLELLVVIAIIGILAGLMFPAVTAINRKVQNTHAEHTATHLKNAISAYNTDHRKYPVDPAITDESNPIPTGHALMDVLLGADHHKKPGGLNPGGTVYFQDRNATPLGGGRYRKGITLETDGSGELWDPWGEPYFVRMDLDHNGRLERPTWDTTGSGALASTIIVWSAGRDLSETDAKDNIKIW